MNRQEATRRFSRFYFVVLVVVGLAACVAEPAAWNDVGSEGSVNVYNEGELPVGEESTDEELFETETGAGELISKSTSVGDIVDRWGCSTAPTMPLNEQIAAQMNCIEGGFFERIDDIPNVRLGSAANPFLQAPAARALRRVAASNPGTTFSVTSSWRSVVQQYILDSWEGSCGIGVAASPGNSNHESGLAIDVPLSTTTAFRSSLRSNGFRWYCDATNGGSSSGCRDTPHHDYTSGGADLRSRAVLAFQQLWNNAHPEDIIAEDGIYGRQTASRIRRAPVSGFEAGPTCSSSPTPFCGDGTCDADEDCSACSSDCGECAPVCGDGRCDAGEDCSSCSSDCGDCGPECGDGVCDSSEDCRSCSWDCGECAAECGDGVCDSSEDCRSCSWDCGACGPVCGDGSCDSGENCASCARDCGACGPVCGDGVCESGEDCESCSSDCGECSGCGVAGHGDSGENGDPCWEADETWRCAFSDHWGTNISQVCRDGSWLTYQLDPRDCDACCGDYSSACRH